MLLSMATVQYQKPAKQWRPAGSDHLCCHPFDFTQYSHERVGHPAAITEFIPYLLCIAVAPQFYQYAFAFRLNRCQTGCLMCLISLSMSAPCKQQQHHDEQLLCLRPLCKPNEQGCSCSPSPMCVPPEPQCDIEDGQHHHQEACNDPAAPDSLALFSLQPACCTVNMCILSRVLQPAVSSRWCHLDAGR